MRLGKYNLGIPVFLAPMAGVTDKAFRETVVSVGGKYVWTEMISDKALNYHNTRTLKMLNLEGEPEPRIVQLFGSEPETMARAALLAVDGGANVIDINMGCPTPKITRNGEGSALLLNINDAREIAAEVVKTVNVPVTVKIRIGWNLENAVAVELAQRLEDAGVQMISLHARTREQFYSGKADWAWIKKVKKSLQIPVIGNGDITTPQEAKLMVEQTGCDGVMIGRAALGNPWLITQTQTFLEKGELLPGPTSEEKIEVILSHFEKLIQYKGERVGINEMRKHAVWYIKGVKHAARLRDSIMQTKEAGEMRGILQHILQEDE